MSVLRLPSIAPLVSRAAEDEEQAPLRLTVVDEHRQFVTELFERHRASLLRFLIDLLSGREEAEDVVQEAYVRLLGLDRLDRSGTRARAYLYRVATNLAYDRFRQRRVRGVSVEIDAMELASDDPQPERVVAFEQQFAALGQVLAELEPRCRRVFLLRAAEHLRYEEIAEHLGVSKRTVEREMKQALDVCQEKLKRL